MINAGGQQVGHVPRAVAGKLAWLMDERLVTVEGRMAGQNLDGARHYKLAVDMSIYARPSLREVLESEIAWATPGQQGFEAMRNPTVKGKGRADGTHVGGSKSSGVGLPTAQDEEMRKLLEGLEKVGEDEKQADGVMVSSHR